MAESARRGFATTVLAGLGGGLVAAVGGNRSWATVRDDGSATSSIAAVAASAAQATAPLVTALALVALAAWGVVLVTRGLFRRAVTWLGALAGLGLVAACVAAWVAAPRAVRDAAGDPVIDVHRTLWPYVALVGALVTTAASAAAVRRVRGWPEMGRRYDAPTSAGATSTEGPAAPVEAEDTSNLDLWRAIDEGRDPTDVPRAD